MEFMHSESTFEPDVAHVAMHFLTGERWREPSRPATAMATSAKHATPDVDVQKPDVDVEEVDANGGSWEPARLGCEVPLNKGVLVRGDPKKAGNVVNATPHRTATPKRWLRGLTWSPSFEKPGIWMKALAQSQNPNQELEPGRT